MGIAWKMVTMIELNEAFINTKTREMWRDVLHQSGHSDSNGPVTVRKVLHSGIIERPGTNIRTGDWSNTLITDNFQTEKVTLPWQASIDGVNRSWMMTTISGPESTPLIRIGLEINRAFPQKWGINPEGISTWLLRFQDGAMVLDHAQGDQTTGAQPKLLPDELALSRDAEADDFQVIAQQTIASAIANAESVKGAATDIATSQSNIIYITVAASIVVTLSAAWIL